MNVVNHGGAAIVARAIHGGIGGSLLTSGRVRKQTGDWKQRWTINRKSYPKSDPFPLSRHCLPKTHTPPHLPQTAPQLETKHPNTWTYRDYFTSKLDRHQLHSRSAGARLRRAESWDETIHMVLVMSITCYYRHLSILQSSATISMGNVKMQGTVSNHMTHIRDKPVSYSQGKRQLVRSALTLGWLDRLYNVSSGL